MGKEIVNSQGNYKLKYFIKNADKKLNLKIGGGE